MLEILQKGVQTKEVKVGKIHQVFRVLFDAKEVEGITGINHVLEYMHRNPVCGKWNLVEDFIKYLYSSTKFYENRIMRDFDVYDFRELVISESPLDD